MSALATLVVGLALVIIGLFALVDWLLDERSRERHYQRRLERRRMGLEAAAMAPPRASGPTHRRIG